MFLQVPETEIIKIAAALGFFFLALPIVAYLAIKKAIGEDTLARLLMGMLVVMAALLGVSLDFQQLRATLIGSASRPSPASCSVAAYGLTLEKLHVSHTYTFDAGFRGEWRYRVKNATSIPVRLLLPDQAGFFGKDFVNRSSAKLQSGGGFMQIDFESFDAVPQDVDTLDGRAHGATYLKWQPRIKPALPPGEELEYSVFLETDATERDAFSETGSYAGAATFFTTEELSMEFHAPDGFMFLDKGFVLHDRTGAIVKQDVRAPTFSEDGSSIEWEVKAPIPSVMYLIRVVLVARH